jgi:hypothetical protein
MDVTVLFQIQQISLVKVTLQHSSLKFVLVNLKLVTQNIYSRLVRIILFVYFYCNRKDYENFLLAHLYKCNNISGNVIRGAINTRPFAPYMLTRGWC